MFSTSFTYLYYNACDWDQIEHVIVVPPVAAMMMKNSHAHKYRLPHLSDMLIGGAPLKADVEYLLLNKYPALQLRQSRPIFYIFTICNKNYFWHKIWFLTKFKTVA